MVICRSAIGSFSLFLRFLRRFHFFNRMLRSQTHTLKGWPGLRLVKIGLATGPRISQWQFQNSFVGAWVKLVALLKQWESCYFQGSAAWAVALLSVGDGNPRPKEKKNVKQLVVATSQKKGEQRPKLGAETLWFPWCLQFVPLELDYEKVEIHRYLQWFCACTA